MLYVEIGEPLQVALPVALKHLDVVEIAFIQWTNVEDATSRFSWSVLYNCRGCSSNAAPVECVVRCQQSTGELPAKIEDLQRQLNELKTVVGLDARVRELAERVGELEKTHSLEARFIKLANDVKREPEIPQSALLSKIEHLQRQFDELKKVAAQPGPQGPPGKL